MGILIVVPVLCLIALYGFAASITLGSALTQSHAKAIATELLRPISTIQEELAAERHLAVLSLADPTSTQAASALGIQEAKTQKEINALQPVIAKAAQGSSSAERQAISGFLNASAQKMLNGLRGNVADGSISISAAIDSYNSIINSGYTVLRLASSQQTNVSVVTQALDVIDMDQALQSALAESDLLTADMTQRKFPAIDRITFAELATLRQALMAKAEVGLQPAYMAVVSHSLTPTISNSLTGLENDVISTPWHKGPPPAELTAHASAFGSYATSLNTVLATQGDMLQSQSQHDANVVFIELILAAGLGLLGTVGSVALSLIIGGGLVRQLRQLRESALALAHERLPKVIGQLRAGEQVDPAEYTPDEVVTDNEIEQVQYAFNVVQQTAVQSAVDEARLRRGISDVFRNLAGRSQSLLHRQLTLLDGMERRATEPGELEDLFRIDHLTTRMRRHAEGLIILSGEAPARGWRQPVPLVDVLRAAVAEVEDYTRIRVLSRTNAAVAGHAVADVIHLIAELAENATVFSPPNTPVRIQGDIVGRGFAIEIEDRGLGISQARMEEINTNLANPPQFDLSGSDRLGLFIAGQLAQRHDIKITLRPSVYGGTTAIVLIPTGLVVEDETYERDPALPAAPPASARPDGNSGRHAAISQVGATNGHGYGPPELRPGFGQADLTIGAGSADEASTGIIQPEPFSPDWPGQQSGPGTGESEPVRLSWAPDAAGTSSESEPEPVRLSWSDESSGPVTGESEPVRLTWSDDLSSTGGTTTTSRADAEAGSEPQPVRLSWSADTLSPSISSAPDPVERSWSPDPPRTGSESGSEPRPVRLGWPDPAGTTSAPGRERLSWPDDVPARSVPARSVPVSREPGEDGPSATVTSGDQPGSEPGELGLPRRVRQANLAPQLRVRPEPAGAPSSPSGNGQGSVAGRPHAAGSAPAYASNSGPPAAPTSAPASPEAARSTMSALQRGWQRGRTEAPQDLPEPPPPAYRRSHDSGGSVFERHHVSAEAAEPDSARSADQRDED